MKKRGLARKSLAMTMAALMAAGMVTGCSSSSKETEAPAKDASSAPAAEGETAAEVGGGAKPPVNQ